MAFVVYMEAKEWEVLEWQRATTVGDRRTSMGLLLRGFLQVWDHKEKIICENRDIDNTNDSVDTTKPKKTKENALVYYSREPN
jgi:hypothetical protein